MKNEIVIIDILFMHILYSEILLIKPCSFLSALTFFFPIITFLP